MSKAHNALHNNCETDCAQRSAQRDVSDGGLQIEVMSTIELYKYRQSLLHNKIIENILYALYYDNDGSAQP